MSSTLFDQLKCGSKLTHRWKRTYWKLFCYLTCGCAALIFICKYLSSDSTSVSFEVHKCPACFGKSLCSRKYQGSDIQLQGWFQWKLLGFFNVKNVFFAEYNGHRVVLKKLAHELELDLFDQALCKGTFDVHRENCDLGKAATLKFLENENKDLNFGNTDTLGCMSSELLQKIQSSVHPNDSEPAELWTLLNINPEPLILQTFRQEDGWPFPKYIGACGRVVVEEYIGPSLYDVLQQKVHWRTRLSYAYQLAFIADKLTNYLDDFSLYLTDATLSNFAVSMNGTIVLVDSENIVIVNKMKFRNSCDTNCKMHANEVYDDVKLIFSVSDLCSHQSADHNYYVICQGLLAENSWSRQDLFEGRGFLHDIPDYFDRRWNISGLVRECAKPSHQFGRFEAFPKLLSSLRGALQSTEQLAKE